jgi:hypothetical protein
MEVEKIANEVERSRAPSFHFGVNGLVFLREGRGALGSMTRWR